jgi:hypothetical protein
MVKNDEKMPRFLSAMPGKKIKDPVRAKIKELLPRSTRKGLPEALPWHLPNECAEELRAISPRTIARIAAEAKKVGEPHRRSLRCQSVTLEQRQVQMRRQARKKRLDQALEAFHAGETYGKAAADAGISVSTLYRHCRVEASRRKDAPLEGLQKGADQAE